MADIRQYTTVLDDFSRADENPIGPPWAGANVGVWAPMALSANHIVGNATPPTSSGSYWTSDTWSGDEAEAWATAIGTVSNNEDWRLGLMRYDGVAVRDGYTFHYGITAGTDEWTLRRYDNGLPSTIAIDTNPTLTLSEGELCLIRRNGNNVEGWLSEDSGANWTLILSANDTTYTTDFYGMLGAGGTSTGWDGFGGGRRHRGQFYRWVLV